MSSSMSRLKQDDLEQVAHRPCPSRCVCDLEHVQIPLLRWIVERSCSVGLFRKASVTSSGGSNLPSWSRVGLPASPWYHYFPLL